jgi:hypothetical protein
MCIISIVSNRLDQVECLRIQFKIKFYLKKCSCSSPVRAHYEIHLSFEVFRDPLV